jgi:hypothetical protein
MKTHVPTRNLVKALCLCTTIVLLLCTRSQASVKPATTEPYAGPRDTILISKTQSSRKHKIRLYPNADNNVLFFSASGETGRVYQLYLFDMDGKLSKQVQIRNKETTVLTNIIRGNYLFEVFSDDERIENGQVVIR